MTPPIQTETANTTTNNVVGKTTIEQLKANVAKAAIKTTVPVVSSSDLLLKDYERTRLTPHIGTEFAEK
jgi:hypothetical protein